MIYEHRLYQEDLEAVACEDIGWKELKGKSILITGASGAIGTFFVDVLMKRNEIYQDAIKIYALSRNIEKLKNRFKQYLDYPCLVLIEQDVSKEFFLEGYHFDFVIHAASNTHPKEYLNDPVGTITANIFGSYYLLEYVRKQKKCRFVLLSSVEVYGENRGDVKYFNENYCGYLDCNTLRAGYPESKRVAESLFQSYIEQYGVEGVVVRLCRIYGPTMEEDDSKAISQFVHKAVVGEDIVLKSAGDQFYSYIYVADAVKAILQCMLKGKSGEAYNVANNTSDTTLKGLAQLLAQMINKTVVLELPDISERKGYSIATRAVLNAEKLKRQGWNPRYSLQDGLKRTLKILKDEGYWKKSVI